ncbi:MAG TPA: DUF6153 family protein [Pseudonocardiaceae bacterium]|jgi:hypothetical protein
MMRHQWLLIVVIVAGLLGMHHLIHVHTEHTKTVASATPTADSHHAPFELAPVAMTSPLVPHADCCDPLNMMGHLCLAVLTVLTALVVALIFAIMWRRPLQMWSVLATVSAVAARAPPTGRPRLTQLCVLMC